MRKPQDILWRSFPRGLENEFQELYRSNSLPFVRFGLSLGAVLYILFFFWDITLDARDAPRTLLIRVPASLLMIAVAFAMPHYNILQIRMQAMMSVLLTICGCGIVVILCLINNGMTLGIGGLILVLMYIFGFARLLFIPSVVSGILVVMSWNAAAVMVNTPLPYIISNDFFLVSAGVIGACTTYLLEKLFRAQFIANKNIESERARANHFVAAISYDLRQPLTTLALRLSSLRSRVDVPEILTDIDMLQTQTSAIEAMVSGTLDLSRLHAGTWVVQPREAALPHIIDKIAGDLAPEAASKGVGLEFSVLPVVVRTDPIAVERILRNLLMNAIRYTPTDTRYADGRVRLECTEGGSTVCISVIDNGIGIPQDKIDDVFKEYVQLANPERDRTKGLGLGLSIVQGLVSLLGHRLEVESVQGEGSRFSLFLPIVSRIPQELLSHGTREGGEPDLTGLTIALVEDESGPREALRERLVEWGCHVIDGESSKDVIGIMMDEEVFDQIGLVISDYRLREGETGVAAIAAIRAAAGASIPAAIWSAETAPMVLQEIAAEGLELLSKPPNEQLLLKLLIRHKPLNPAAKGIDPIRNRS